MIYIRQISYFKIKITFPSNFGNYITFVILMNRMIVKNKNKRLCSNDINFENASF
jgi:hypothetical protein